MLLEEENEEKRRRRGKRTAREIKKLSGGQVKGWSGVDPRPPVVSRLFAFLIVSLRLAILHLPASIRKDRPNYPPSL